MFDIELFIEDCKAMQAAGDNQPAVHDLLTGVVNEPAQVLKALGEPERAGVTKLYHSPELTILNIVWGPYMTLLPHNHQMWAAVGIYTGREDNIFWRRTPEGIKAFGADALFVKDTAMLPEDALHSVTNPLQRFTGGIHIYGGDFGETTRSQWKPETLEEAPSDGAKIREMFRR